MADAAFADGGYAAPPLKGLRAFGRVYAWDGRSRKTSSANRRTGRWGSPRSRRRSNSSKACSWGATPTTSWRCSGRGSTPTLAPTRATRATFNWRDITRVYDRYSYDGEKRCVSWIYAVKACTPRPSSSIATRPAPDWPRAPSEAGEYVDVYALADAAAWQLPGRDRSWTLALVLT